MRLRRFVLALAALGTLVSGMLFAMTWTHPLLLEQGLREVARVEVERRIGARVDALGDSRVAGFARGALAKVDADLVRREDELRHAVPGLVAKTVTDMTDADCECRRRLAAAVVASAEADIGRLTNARDRLVEVIEHTYAVVRAGLLRDARIVLSTNAVAFLAIGLLALAKPRGGPHLLIPTAAVLLAVAITLYGYLFNQDWLHTLVYGDFTGFAYVAWFAVVAGALLDIGLNKGRVCVRLLNLLMDALGVAVTLLPC